MGNRGAGLAAGGASRLRDPGQTLATSRRAGLFRHVSLATVLSMVVSTPTAQITYVYDEAGQLRQATSPAGSSVQYTYDAAGNITGIAQVPAGTLSIVEVTPNAASIGSPVQIFGTGFSSTPGLNSVAVNGTTANVTAATPTHLTISVPPGATTGHVTVQVGSASIPSAQQLAVHSGSTSPSIASFSPSLGVVGDPVTINGANFEPELANNRLAFHRSLSQVTTATLGQLQSKVPVHATPGRLQLLTPEGEAISTADFFVVPPGYTTASVGFTGRSALPATTPMTLATGKIGLLVFDGTAGQELAVGVPALTVTPAGAPASISVKTPTGADLMPTQGFYSATGFSLPKLPETGTYALLIEPYNQSYALNASVSVSQDVAGSIVPGGPSVTAATSYAGQRVLLGFEGTAGQRVSLRTSGVSFAAGNSMVISIAQPDGSILANVPFVSTGGSFIDTQNLPQNGSYRVVADPSAAALATATFTLHAPVDLFDSITPGGASVTAGTTVPGQSVNLAFTGTASQRISVDVTNTALTGAWSQNWADVTLLGPSGQNLGVISNISAWGFLEPVTLANSGNHTIRFHPINGATGSATIRAYVVPSDASGSIVAGGSSVTTALSVPGQNANLSFSATSGQRVSLSVTGAVLTGQSPAYLNSATYRILKSDGTMLASTNGGSSSLFVDTTTLAATDTYTVNFDPSASTIGTATFTLHDVPADPTSSVSVNGGTTTVTLSVPGQNGYVNFSGTAAQQVTVRITNNTVNGQMTVALRSPTGSTLSTRNSSAASFDLPSVALPSTGTYTIFANPSAGAVGSLTIAVTSP